MTIIRETKKEHTVSMPIITSGKEKKVRTSPECVDCKINVYAIQEYCFLILNSLWNKYCEDIPKELICVGCLEKRIGRQLISSDFSNVTLNDIELFKRSERLYNRMTSASTSTSTSS